MAEGTRIVRLLLAAELRSVWNWVRFSRRGMSAALGVTLAALPFGFLLGLAMFGAGYVVARLAIAPAPLFALGFFTVSLAVFVFGLPGVIGSFFGDRQLLLLASAPIPAGAVFTARLLQASLPALAAGLLVLSGAAGYGAGRGIGLPYYLLSVLLVAAMALSVVAVAVVLMTLVLRVVPAARARDVAGLLAAALAASFYLLQVVATPARFARGQPSDAARRIASQVSAFGSDLIWFPTTWPAEALANWATVGPLASLPWIALSLGFLGLAWLLAWRLYARTFVLGLGVFGEAGAVSPRRTASVRRRPAHDSPARPIAALVYKDLVTLRRDLRRLAGALPALVMAVAYSFVNSRGQGGGVWPVILPLGFVPVMVSGALALPAVSVEGRGILLLALAGTSMRRLLAAKLVFAGSIVAGMAVAAALMLSLRRGETSIVLLAVPVAAWLGAGCAAIAVSFGAMGPNFQAPADRARGNPAYAMGALVAMGVFAGLTYGAIAAAGAAAGGGAWTVPLVTVAVVAGAMSVALVVAALVVGLERLEQLRPGDDWAD